MPALANASECTLGRSDSIRHAFVRCRPPLITWRGGLKHRATAVPPASKKTQRPRDVGRDPHGTVVVVHGMPCTWMSRDHVGPNQPTVHCPPAQCARPGAHRKPKARHADADADAGASASHRQVANPPNLSCGFPRTPLVPSPPTSLPSGALELSCPGKLCCAGQLCCPRGAGRQG